MDALSIRVSVQTHLRLAPAIAKRNSDLHRPVRQSHPDRLAVIGITSNRNRLVSLEHHVFGKEARKRRRSTCDRASDVDQGKESGYMFHVCRHQSARMFYGR
jgi:hypothetical protein